MIDFIFLSTSSICSNMCANGFNNFQVIFDLLFLNSIMRYRSFLQYRTMSSPAKENNINWDWTRLDDYSHICSWSIVPTE